MIKLVRGKAHYRTIHFHSGRETFLINTMLSKHRNLINSHYLFQRA